MMNPWLSGVRLFNYEQILLTVAMEVADREAVASTRLGDKTFKRVTVVIVAG